MISPNNIKTEYLDIGSYHRAPVDGWKVLSIRINIPTDWIYWKFQFGGTNVIRKSSICTKQVQVSHH